mgnify:CR=1 FL=1
MAKTLREQTSDMTVKLNDHSHSLNDLTDKIRDKKNHILDLKNKVKEYKGVIDFMHHQYEERELEFRDIVKCIDNYYKNETMRLIPMYINKHMVDNK